MCGVMGFRMKKLLVYLALVVLAIALAALYGILHNQISYTVSPEYFTKFKFYQFGLVDSALPERVRASIVGFHASWWMGIPIGMLAGIPGFMHPGPRRMLNVSLQAMLMAVGFTLVFGLCGLVYGFLQTSSIDLAAYQNWWIPSDLENVRRFLCAGYMHNSAYLGGVLSIPVAWIYHIVVKLRAS